jgi:hypothetical protein
MRILAVVLLAAGMCGRAEHCYGYREHVTVMPDGSGKVDVVCSTKDDDADFDYLKVVRCTRGAAAFTAPRIERKEGWSHLNFTVYFEDLQKLSYNDNGPDKTCARGHDECIHFALARGADGFVLTIEDWIFSKGPYPDRSDWDKVRDECQNVIVRTVTLPGKVKKADGYQRTDGRQAVYERSPKTIGKLEDAIDWPAAVRRRIECGPSEVTDADAAAFKKELEGAKAAWPKIKAELEQAKKEH